jgi:putative transposase
MTSHLGYGKHDAAGYNTGNSRNGTTKKKLKGDFGEIELETPRDRNGCFEPRIVGKRQTRFTGFDDKILSMYARGMTTRDIQGHLEEIYGIEVSPALVSEVTDAVTEEVKSWQSRPLEAVYPVVYMDALYVKVRENGQVQNRAIHVAIAIRMDGCKEVLGLWGTATEGAKFWLQVINELKNRGVQDIFVACVDGLKGFPEAIEAVFPKTQVQLCVVHLVRASMQYVSWKLRKSVAADLRTIYTAPTAEAAADALERFADKWDKTHPAVSQVWRRNWSRITPFFAFAPDIRKVIYTTNAIESLNMTLRKVIKTRASFPNEEAATKLLYLALLNVAKKWNSVQNWREALNQFQIMWPERMPAEGRC